MFHFDAWVRGSGIGDRAEPRLVDFSRTVGLTLVVVLALGTAVVANEPTLDELLDLEPSRPAQSEPDEVGDSGESTEPGEAFGVPGVDPSERPAFELDEDVRRMLRGDEAADAFEQAVRQMDQVARRLGGELDPGLVTQREQESILAKLDQVIEAARQQQSSPQGGQGGGGENQPQQRARDQDAGGQDLARQQGQQGQDGQQGQPSQAQAGGENPGRSSAGSVIEGEQHEGPLEELRREWGQLPPRLRDEISEGLQERFSPAYRSLTEAYYRRLAEEE